MSKLLIIGAGGHGQVVADAAETTGNWREIAFLDDRTDRPTASSDWRVLGPLTALAELRARYDSVAIGIGDNKLRVQLYRRTCELGFLVPTVVHPTASVSRYADLGSGTVVLAQSVINVSARLGAVCIVNTGASVDHDCILEDGVHVSPGAVLAGNVHIGACTHIGIGSSVRDGICIGTNAKLGAGAVAVQDIADGVTAVGMPAKSRSDAAQLARK